MPASPMKRPAPSTLDRIVSIEQAAWERTNAWIESRQYPDEDQHSDTTWREWAWGTATGAVSRVGRLVRRDRGPALPQ